MCVKKNDSEVNPSDFYEMVKNWTKYDYDTPGIKAEVIIDMLISEFIEEIVAVRDPMNMDQTIKLLTKEFPIRTLSGDKSHYIFVKKTTKNNKEYGRCARVDYLLLSGDKNIIMTELKTTPGSFDEKQLARMIYARSMGWHDALCFYELKSIKKRLINHELKEIDCEPEIVYVCLKGIDASNDTKTMRICDVDYKYKYNKQEKCIEVEKVDDIIENEKTSFRILTIDISEKKIQESVKEAIEESNRKELWEKICKLIDHISKE